jgi:hypothetical protein
MNIEKICFNDQLIALIIYHEDVQLKAEFYTPDAQILQIGKHFRKKGENIKPHKHLIAKIIKHESPQEVLYIEDGKMKVNFYTEDGKLVDSKIVGKGDMVLLSKGGHGFEFIEDTRMIEVKEGPVSLNKREHLEVEEGQ